MNRSVVVRAVADELGIRYDFASRIYAIYRRFGSNWFTSRDLVRGRKRVPDRVHVFLSRAEEKGFLESAPSSGRYRKMYRLRPEVFATITSVLERIKKEVGL